MGLERKVRSWKPILKPKFGGYLEQYVGTSQDDNVNNLCMGLGGETQETMCPQATDKLVKSSQMMGKTYSQLVGGVPTYGGEPVDGLKFVVFLYINMWLRIPFCCRMSSNFCWLTGQTTIFLKLSLLNEFHWLNCGVYVVKSRKLPTLEVKLWLWR